MIPDALSLLASSRNPDQWKDCAEFISISVVAHTWSKITSKTHDKWAMVGSGMPKGYVGVLHGEAPSPDHGQDCLMYKWGTIQELLSYLDISGLGETPDLRIVTECVLDRIIAGTWDENHNNGEELPA